MAVNVLTRKLGETAWTTYATGATFTNVKASIAAALADKTILNVLLEDDNVLLALLDRVVVLKMEPG